MSQSSSSHSSRAQSPLVRSRTPTPLPIIPKKPQTSSYYKKITKSPFFFLFYLLALIPILFYTLFIWYPPYCMEGFDFHCVKCPKHGNCGIYSLKCEEGYTKVDRYCLKGDSSDINNKINELREIKKTVKEQSKLNKSSFSINTNDVEQGEAIDYLISNGLLEEKGENQYSPINFSISLIKSVSLSVTIFFLILTIQLLARF